LVWRRTKASKSEQEIGKLVRGKKVWERKKVRDKKGDDQGGIPRGGARPINVKEKKADLG